MHILQPKHSKISKKEEEELLQKINISKTQLPKIKQTDTALPEGVQIGDIIKIERKDEPRSKTPGLGGGAWVWAEFQTVPYDNIYSPSDPNWDSRQGVGRIFHYNLTGDRDTTIYTFIRGGNWRHGYDSGAFTIHMQPVPGKTNIDDIGFRCVTNPISPK